MTTMGEFARHNYGISADATAVSLFMPAQESVAQFMFNSYISEGTEKALQPMSISMNTPF
jgi:hypothetical protein